MGTCVYIHDIYTLDSYMLTWTQYSIYYTCMHNHTHMITYISADVHTPTQRCTYMHYDTLVNSTCVHTCVYVGLPVPVVTVKCKRIQWQYTKDLFLLSPADTVDFSLCSPASILKASHSHPRVVDHKRGSRTSTRHLFSDIRNFKRHSDTVWITISLYILHYIIQNMIQILDHHCWWCYKSLCMGRHQQYCGTSLNWHQ